MLLIPDKLVHENMGGYFEGILGSYNNNGEVLRESQIVCGKNFSRTKLW